MSAHNAPAQIRARTYVNDQFITVFCVLCVVACRAEVELRQRLAERDARVVALKQQLSDKGRQADTLQRRVNELLGSKGITTSTAGGSAGLASFSRQASASGAAGTSRPRLAALRCTSCNARSSGSWRSKSGEAQWTVEALTAAAADAASAQGDAGATEGSGSQLQQPEQQVAFAAAHGLAAAEKEYLAHQIAALRISLAKRDADVARLEGESACSCYSICSILHRECAS
jgi:hypothetical protein